MRRIALLGAPGTGKTRLAGELAGHFASRGRALAVDTDPTSLQHDATLLMGLDLPGMDDARLGADARLRSQLQAAGIAFDVVYGQGPQRLLSALSALEGRGIQAGASTRKPGGAWNRACEKCSDPECEHRLFTRLVAPGSPPARG